MIEQGASGMASPRAPGRERKDLGPRGSGLQIRSKWSCSLLKGYVAKLLRPILSSLLGQSKAASVKEPNSESAGTVMMT